jgi:uncharacterized protein
MSNAEVIEKTRSFIETKFATEEGAHDWWHLYRVWQLTKHIANQEKDANMLVVELGALLHDIADWKFHSGDLEAGPKAAKEWLESCKADKEIIDQVVYIVRNVSFKGGTNKYTMETIEGMIVQDADRLDGMGAIGIARTFAFGGHLGRQIYDPNNKPKEYKSFEEFKNSLKEGTTINHFYEKLLLLKNRMNTDTGKKMALLRHKYMENFLKEFYAEWEGKI